VILWPHDCEDCSPDDHETFGCGFNGLLGKSRVKYSRGAAEPPYNRSCPRWCWLQPAVQSVYDDLEDYRRGALGNVLDLAAPRIALLRVADSEHRAWEAEQQAQMYEAGVKARGKARH